MRRTAATVLLLLRSALATDCAGGDPERDTADRRSRADRNHRRHRLGREPNSAPLATLLTLLLLATLGEPCPSALAWQVNVGETPGSVRSLSCARDSCVAGGAMDLTASDGESLPREAATVVKLGRSGAVRWQTTVAPFSSWVQTVKLDRRGDVLVGASVGESEIGFGYAVVAKLDGATGDELWRVSSEEDSYSRFAVLSNGDVIVTTSLTLLSPTRGILGYRDICERISGASGSSLWHKEDCGFGVIVDPSGDIIVSGEGGLKKMTEDGTELWRTSRPAQLYDIDRQGNAVEVSIREIRKVSGASGGVIWARDDLGGQSTIRAGRLATDPAGNVIVLRQVGEGSGRGSDVQVICLDGATGQERWQQKLDGERTGDRDQPYTVYVDQRGRVSVAAALVDGEGQRRLAVVQLDGEDGSVNWRQRLTGRGSARVLTSTAEGSLVVGGSLSLPSELLGGASGHTFFVARLHPLSGSGTRRVRIF